MPPPRGKKSKRWLWITLSSVLVVVMICTGAAFALRSYNKEQSAKRAAAYDEQYNPIKREEIDALMAARAKALKDRDEKAFLAPLDPADKKLADQQTVLFRNLVKLPLAEASFAQRQKNDFKRSGAAVSVEQMVAFVHKLDGYDLHPVDQLWWWTIARTEKGAPLRITSIKPYTPKRDTESTNYPAPWDKWRNIHVERTEHTLFIVDASMKAQAQRYAPEAERAVRSNLAIWQDGGVSAEIPRGFVVSLVKGKKDLGSLYRLSKETPKEAGVSFPIPRYFTPDERRDNKSAPLIGGSRVVIDLSTQFFRSGNTGGPGQIFRHELAHSLVATLTARGEDVFFFNEAEWLVEGFAEYMAYQGRSWTTSGRTSGGRAVLRATNYDLVLPETINWEKAERTNYGYWLGHSAVGYMAETYGKQKAFQVVAEHYRGKELKDVMPQVLGVSDTAFEDGWRAYLIAKMR